MLKKFTDFTNEKKTSKSEDMPSTECKSAKKPKVEPKVEPKVVEPKEPKVKNQKMEKVNKITEPKMENFDFVGKIVKFPSNIKPSVSIVMLENNNISKDKLHYIISKQTENTLVLLKYNESVEMKLTDFINTLINYYKENDKIKNIFEKIIIEGNNNFSIIKNIPDIKLGDKQLIQVLNDDIMKLLK